MGESEGSVTDWYRDFSLYINNYLVFHETVPTESRELWVNR